MMKKILSLLLTLVLCFGLTVPAMASDTGAVGSYTTVSAGGGMTAAIKSDNSLWMWGANDNYELGNGGNGNDNYGNGNTPYPIQTVPVKIMDDVVSVSCGTFHVAAIKTDGSLWTWGWGANGELGDGRTGYDHHVATPQKIMDNVVAVSCGYNYTAAIKTDGSLWTWGSNGFGQLGNGGTGNYEWDVPYQTVPAKVMEGVAAVSCGDYTTAIIKTDGSLWMCGSNYYGMIGNGKSGYDANQLLPIKIMDNVVSVTTSSSVTAAVQSDGSLWAWGDNRNGSFGNGTQTGSLTPVKIMDGVVSVSGNGSTIGAIKTDGTLWMWGSNASCQLGNGGGGNATYNYHDIQTVPVKILDNVTSVSINTHVAAIKTDGTLWGWGSNLYGQVGIGSWGTNNTVKFPTQILTNVSIPAKPSPTVAGFNDVHEGDYYAYAVAWAKDSGITGGTTATTFSPSATVTRAQAVTFLWRAAGSPQPSTTVSPFSDVTDPSAYYYNAVLWAAEQGITTGVTATTFGTGSAVAYDQMLAFLARAAGADTGSGSWSDAAISWAADNGLTDGLTFTAKAACPRSDVVYCLWKQLS